MQYNTKREKLRIPDYGRNIQMMIEETTKIKDKDTRNKMALAIIDTMAMVNPVSKDSQNYKHKLWDHLFIISDFKLDVDSPYPKISEEMVAHTPETLKYNNSKFKYRHYGKLLERLIEKTTDFPEGDEKNEIIELIAHQMKRLYLTWNRDTVEDETIIKQFYELTHGKLQLDESFILCNTKDILSNLGQTQTSTGSRKKQKNKQQRIHIANKKKNKN